MISLPSILANSLSPAPIVTLLPGPDRKRTAIPYRYRITYRNPEPASAGCVLMWEVSGGRTAYQLALERDGAGNLRLHCTCADAVFRAENQGRFCKHLHGLLQFRSRDREGALGSAP